MADNVFFLAIEAHIKWKIRLQKHLDGTSTEKLDPEVVCKDDQCVLGKWIYGDGKRFGHMHQFEQLRTTHADFHKCAAEIIRKSDTGAKKDAVKIFENDYVLLSRQITKSLVTMNTTLGDSV